MPPPSGSTPVLGLPYPVPNDPVDVPRDVKALADKLDANLGGGSVGGGILRQAPVLDVGVTGQIRAGRQLTVADFTGLGLAQPVGLWNLSDLTNLGSDARALVNKGAVTFVAGVNGLASTAAQFTGSTAQALYIPDSGGADPYRIRTGSWGCWFRTAKRALSQEILSRVSSALNNGTLRMTVNASNLLQVGVAFTANGFSTGSALDREYLVGISDVADDRWHFAAGTFDGSALRLYVDGALEGQINTVGTVIGANAAPLNIGAYGADSGPAATQPFYGRVDEAFVTNDVLSENHVRLLYAARIAHTLGVAPTTARLNVDRKRKGAPLAPSDFTAQPVRLHNFTAGALTDEGSGGVALTNNGAAVSVAGADGTLGGAYSYAGAQSLSATDAGLPAALTARSYGCWFKTTASAAASVLSWGTLNTAHAAFVTQSTLSCYSGTDQIIGPYIADGQWHFAVEVEDNAAVDGVRRKLYLDGRLVGGSTVMNTLTLAGANRFRVGALADGTLPFTGQIDGAFITNYPLDPAEIARLYAKGSQSLGASPKNAGDHVERLDAASVLAIFDTLESQHQIDLGVTP